MLRFTLFALVVMVVAAVVFGCKMSSIHTHHTDSVSQVESFMSAK